MLHNLIKPLLVIFAIVQIALASNLTTTITGKVDLTSVSKEVNRKTLNRISVSLHQIYKNSTNSNNFYSSQTTLQNKAGDFQFANVQLDLSENYTYFVLSAKSPHFNFQPNKLLVKIQNNDTSVIDYFGNVFGREYFPSAEILYPEELPQLKKLVFKPVPEAPFRNYLQPRKGGLLTSGPLGSIFQSTWKTAALATLIFTMCMPYIIDWLDPETAKAIKAEKAKKQRNKFNIPQAKKD